MNTVVKTRYGEVRGSVADGVNTFKGIPYAAPPFGANRLRPPQPVAPWSGVRDALTYGPKTPQPSYPPEVSVLLPELAIPGEDCLTLNIWSPDLGSFTGRFFEHGDNGDNGDKCPQCPQRRQVSLHKGTLSGGQGGDGPLSLTHLKPSCAWHPQGPIHLT